MNFSCPQFKLPMDRLTFVMENWSARLTEKACVNSDKILNSSKKRLFFLAKGVVLEIGAGTGLNKKHIPGASEYIALEPKRRFHAQLISVADTVLRATAEAIPLPDASVDCVICSMCLCSVASLDQTLSEAYRVLKPGGKMFALEHVGALRGTAQRFFQQVCSPICRRLDCGCRPDRDILPELYSSKFTVIACEKFDLKFHSPLVRHWIAVQLTKTS